LLSVLPVMEVDSFLTGKRGVSLPFSDMCEPLVGGKKDFEELFRQALVFGKKNNWHHLELRGGRKYLEDEQESEEFTEHVLDLSGGVESVLKRLRNSTQRNIKKAEKSGVEISISTTPEALSSFCRLNRITRKDHGLPPQPMSFFRKVHERILVQKKGFIVLGTFERTVVAASVFMLFGNQALYKYGASDKFFQNLRANNAVMWHAIQWCCENGYKTLHFGRTEPENTGLQQFKMGWGVQEQVLRYYRYDLLKDEFIRKVPIVCLQKRLIEHLPIPVLNAAGKILYRHMG
jgi:lipid II:glycine glycyltransferase (peptidoglycan interpeptide bridge formation enzyme)